MTLIPKYHTLVLPTLSRVQHCDTLNQHLTQQ